LGRGELLVELRIPRQAERTGSHYRRFIPRNEMDIAVVGVGASITLSSSGKEITAARMGLGAVAPKPIAAVTVNEYLLGKSPSPETFAEAARIARTLISPIDDHRGTVEFRTHVTGVLVERVLAEAARRALR
jgi:carbon-monoxide dehydrogenase medium subunit